MPKVNLEDVAREAGQGVVEITAQPKLRKAVQPEEKKTSRNMVNLKPSEYEAFVALIGRESFSEAVRKLVLKAVEQGAK